MSHDILWQSSKSLYPQLIVFKDAKLEDLILIINEFLSVLCLSLSEFRNTRVEFSIVIKQMNNVDSQGNRWYGTILYNKRRREISIPEQP